VLDDDHHALIRLNDRLVLGTAQLVDALRRSAAEADRRVVDSRQRIEESVIALQALVKP
jgi:hypothetical protein